MKQCISFAAAIVCLTATAAAEDWTGTPQQLAIPGATLSVDIHPSRPVVAAAGNRGEIAVFGLPGGEPLTTLPHRVNHPAGVVRVLYGPGGRRMVSCGADGSVRLWDISVEPPRLADEAEDFDGIQTAVAFTKDGETLAVGERGGEGKVRLYSVGERLDLRRVLRPNRGPVWALAFETGGESLLIGTGARDRRLGTLMRMDVRSEVATPVYVGRRQAPLRLAVFSPDGRMLVVNDGPDVVLLDGRNGRVLRTLSGHRQPAADGGEPQGVVTQAAFTPDGGRLVTGGYDAVRLWDPATGEEVAILTGEFGKSEGVAVTADGTTLVCAEKVMSGKERQFNGLLIWTANR